MKKKITLPSASRTFPEAERLLAAGRTDAAALLSKYGTTLSGFTEEQAEELRDRYGKNEIAAEKAKPLYRRVLDAFLDPFTSVLLALAVISLITDVFMQPDGQKNPSTALIIFAMVLISGGLRFFQETRSGRSAQKLKEMVHTTATAARGESGKLEIPLAEIVPGDILYLAAGDIVPADVRVLSCKDLFISQSAMTGESEPIEKYDQTPETEVKNPLEMRDLAFMGSTVVSGSAVCIALVTGDGTCFGSMAKAVTGKRADTSFEKGVRSVSLLDRKSVV